VNERDFQDKVKKELENLGFFVYIPFDTIHQGVPDIFCAKDGRAMWIELKFHKGGIKDGAIRLNHEVSAQQSSFLRRCQVDAGVLVGLENGGYILVDKTDVKPGPNSTFLVKKVADDLSSIL